jgi:hypothetical protein
MHIMQLRLLPLSKLMNLLHSVHFGDSSVVKLLPKKLHIEQHLRVFNINIWESMWTALRINPVPFRRCFAAGAVVHKNMSYQMPSVVWAWCCVLA